MAAVKVRRYVEEWSYSCGTAAIVELLGYLPGLARKVRFRNLNRSVLCVLRRTSRMDGLVGDSFAASLLLRRIDSGSVPIFVSIVISIVISIVFDEDRDKDRDEDVGRRRSGQGPRQRLDVAVGRLSTRIRKYCDIFLARTRRRRPPRPRFSRSDKAFSRTRTKDEDDYENTSPYLRARPLRIGSSCPSAFSPSPGSPARPGSRG